MIKNVYYFDLGLLECNETKIIKDKARQVSKKQYQKRKLAMFNKIGKFVKS